MSGTDGTMRTDIEMDERLMAEAIAAGGLPTTRAGYGCSCAESGRPMRATCSAASNGRTASVLMAGTSQDKPGHDEGAASSRPGMTAEDFVRARPASELVPKFIGQTATDELMRRAHGRPAKPDRKVNQTLRLDPDVLDAYRREGPGWQALMNKVLRQHMPRLGKS